MIISCICGKYEFEVNKLISLKKEEMSSVVFVMRHGFKLPMKKKGNYHQVKQIIILRIYFFYF